MNYVKRIQIRKKSAIKLNYSEILPYSNCIFTIEKTSNKLKKKRYTLIEKDLLVLKVFFFLNFRQKFKI